MKLKEFLETISEYQGCYAKHCYAFYDWFCDREQLFNRANRLLPYVKSVVKQFNLKVDDLEITLKNCAGIGTYDICFIERVDAEGNTHTLVVTPKAYERFILGYSFSPSPEIEKPEGIMAVNRYFGKQFSSVEFEAKHWREFKQRAKNNEYEQLNEVVALFQ